ncbi:MAG TPA: FkbM family methyltransferase [Gammaproteobacteria bacterium]|nr:FkbM family methyltransferase [Gammaproteobacteria bacterium]
MKVVDLERVTVGGLHFLTRPGSSDIKSIREVVEKRSYHKRAFELGERPWIDLGANVGAFTVLAASLGQRVTAYEPDPDNFALLEQNVEQNKLGRLVELKQLAVVASDATKVRFHVNSARGNFWRNSTVKVWRGGYSIDVPAVHFSKALDGAHDVKMDIEGAEMPILEAMTERPGPRLVFEWSFDIDRSVPRFRAVVEKLRSWYGSVTYGKFDETVPMWGESWFPPCRTVWCFDNGPATT